MLQEPKIVKLDKIEGVSNVLGNLSGKKISFTVQNYQIDRPFNEWSRSWRKEMPDQKSGVYIFRDPKGEVIYIGKATKDNLGAEIWSKFKIPPKEKSQFINSPFLSEKHYPDVNLETRQAILDGNIYLTILSVNPPYIASLLEVYLQTIYQNEKGELPVLNRRIG